MGTGVFGVQPQETLGASEAGIGFKRPKNLAKNRLWEEKSSHDSGHEMLCHDGELSIRQAARAADDFFFHSGQFSNKLLEFLTKPLGPPMGNFDAGDLEKGLVDIVSALVAGSQASVLLDVGEGTFHLPAIMAEGFVAFLAPRAKVWLDAEESKVFADRLAVVSLVGVKLDRSLLAENLGEIDGDERHEEAAVVDVGGGEGAGQREAVGIGEKMMFGPRSGAIGRIRAAAFPPRPQPAAMLSPQALVTNRSGRFRPVRAAGLLTPRPRRRTRSTSAVASNKSYRSRSPFRAADLPRECLS